MRRPIAAVLFDLDDTLFDQAAFLDGAWRRVADVARAYGADAARLLHALHDIAAQGSDRGSIIDRAVARAAAATPAFGRTKWSSNPDESPASTAIWAGETVRGGVDAVPIAPLVEAFRSYRPAALTPYPGVADALARLRARVPIGLVTDGDPGLQWGKVRALGLAGAFDVVVMSDELGRARRKPDPAPFRTALAALCVAPDAAVMVGDRPDKDVAGARAAGIRAIRVRTGEYWSLDNTVRPWHDVVDAVAAVELIEGELGSRTGALAASAPVGTSRGGGR